MKSVIVLVHTEAADIKFPQPQHELMINVIEPLEPTQAVLFQHLPPSSEAMLWDGDSS
jgi:hypothetical protein